MERKNYDGRAKAKRYLRQVQRSWTIARQLREELSRLELAATSLKSQDMGGVRVQSSASPEAPFVKIAERRAEIEIKLKRKILEHDDIRITILEEIQRMEKTEHIKLLTYRYVEDMSMNQIARVMRYSLDRIKHLHIEALDAFYDCNREAVDGRFKDDTF